VLELAELFPIISSYLTPHPYPYDHREQKKEIDTTFSQEEAAKWNERVKRKTKSRGVSTPTTGNSSSK